MYIRILGSAPGESVIIIFDCGSIITIDCCCKKGENFVINSIKELGLDFKDVIYNVITHFHDDHIRGASELILNSPNARVVIPDAWTQDVFKQFVASISEEATFGSFSVTREIEKVFDVLGSTPERLFMASELTSLYPLPARHSPKGESLTVLTPSALRKTNFLTSLGAEISKGTSSAFKFCETNKNWTSISCVVEYEGRHILLAGDVENVSPDFDLRQVHVNHLSSVSRYELVKLPHHGSETSFCDELRGLIHNTETVVAITPFPGGHKRLPSEATRGYLAGAERVYVLAGAKIGLKREQRMTRKNLVAKAIPSYRPGILDFTDGDISMILCKPLAEFLDDLDNI